VYDDVTTRAVAISKNPTVAWNIAGAFLALQTTPTVVRAIFTRAEGPI